MFILLNKSTIEGHICRLILKLVTAVTIQTIVSFKTSVKHKWPRKRLSCPVFLAGEP